MNRLITGICLTMLLFPVQALFANEAGHPKNMVGTLRCNVMPNGVNLLIHSTRYIQCRFTPSDGGPVERYKGETGIKLGFDVNLSGRVPIVYSVLADHFRPGSHQLAGRYSGVGGVVRISLSIGDTSPIEKRSNSITLQPIGFRDSGVGASAGLTYLYLEAANE